MACDEAILDRFFASGLSDPGPAHLRLEAPGQPADTDPPAIATSADAGIVGRVRIKADRRAEPTVYAAERRADGTLLEARFAKAAIEPGAVARVTRSDHLWRLVDSSGRVLSARQPRVLRRAEPPRPAGVSVGRDGRRARIRWRIRDAGSRATTFYVAAAATRRGLRTSPRIVGRLPSAGAGPYVKVVPVGGSRYLEVRAYDRGRERGSRAVRIPGPG